MIFNNNKIYAKVWKVTRPESGKYIDLQITTSEKNQAGEYVNSSWFPRVFGSALEALKDVKREDRIIITKSKFTNERVETEDGWKSYFHFYIIEAEIEGKNKQNDAAPAATQPDPKARLKEVEVDDCPW